MIKNILGCVCSSAHVSENKLILSLPDAMTPVMWVLDLEESKTILLKVSAADNNMFVLQKINRSGTKEGNGNVEDIAYYNSKGKAVRALNRTTDALNKQSCVGRNRTISGCIWYWVKMALAFLVLMTLLVYWLLGTKFGTGVFLKMIDVQRASTTNTVISAPIATGGNTIGLPSQQLARPGAVTQPGSLAVTPANRNPNAVGVPLSADDLIKKQPMGF